MDWVKITAYCIGITIFTIVMDNAFAVITTGIPLLIQGHSDNAAIIGVLGMLSDFCGMLMTLMAANFNVVPAALLELKNKHHMIMIQVIPGLVILTFNIFLMYNFAF